MTFSSCCKRLRNTVSLIHSCDAWRKEHTVGKESVRVSVSNSLRGGKTGGGAVTVAVVLSARAVDGRGVSGLVKDGGGLVLGVARPAQSGELVEEQRAVGHVVVGGESVGQDTGGAAAVDVSAVGASDSAGGGAAVAGDGAEASGNGVADRGGGALEEGVEPGGGARCGGGGCAAGQAAAAAEGVGDRSAARAGAVALDNSTLRDSVDGLLDSERLLGVNVKRDSLARVREDVSGQLSRVEVGKEEVAVGGYIVFATLGELVDLSKLNLDLDGLSSGEGLEHLLSEVLVSQTLVEASERGGSS